MEKLAYTFVRSTKNYHVYQSAADAKAPPLYVPANAMPSPVPLIAVVWGKVELAQPAGL